MARSRRYQTCRSSVRGLLARFFALVGFLLAFMSPSGQAITNSVVEHLTDAVVDASVPSTPAGQ